jgi:hypothetical protein
MEFKIKQDLKKRVFITYFSELDGRIDPSAYHFERQEVIAQLEGTGKLFKLKNVVTNAKKITSEILENDIYIGLENIKSDTGEYIPTTSKSSISSAGIFKKGQILFSKLRPYLNKVYLADFDGICSTEFHIFNSKTEFSNEFLAIYLRSDFIVKQTKHLMTGNTLPRLQTSDIDNLPIPKVSQSVQDEIVCLYDFKYGIKIEKEKKAKELLNSIDDYLLDELGITLPLKSNTLSSRIFEIKYTELTGSRFDPGLYNNHTKALKQAIEDSKFKSVPLKELIIQSNAGDWGSESVEDNERLKACLVIRATEFDNDFNLKLDNSRVKYRSISRDKLKKINIQEQDILIEKSGGSPYQPVGRVAILRSDILRNNTICYSNFIHKITLNKSLINPEYAFAYLKTMHNIKLTQSMQSQTNGIRNLIMSNYFNQSIVLPIKTDGSIDMDKQNEIALKISGMRAKAEKLQVGAIASVNDAQKEIEKIILV